MDPVREDPLDRVAHHVEQARVGAVLLDPLGDAVEAGQVRVMGRGLAAHREAVVEAARVPVEAEVPVHLLDEEVELLRLRHLDLGMQAEVVVDARRAALEAADDDQVRHLGVAFAAPPQAALAVGGVALAGAGAHRLVGGIAGRLAGQRVRVGVRHERASVAAMPPADLASSFEAFFNAAADFFATSRMSTGAPSRRLALPRGDAAGPRLGLAQRAARRLSPQQISFLPLAAAYLAGAGINAIIPAHAGDVTKVFLVKRQIPGSSYPAVTSSFLVQTVFDTSVGILVLLYAISQGLLPPLPQIPDLPAFEISFWADHPKTLAIVVGVLLIALASASSSSAHRVRRFWARVKQGLVILTEPRRYLREVAAWQGVGWLFRFAAFWFFLEAFGIGGSIGNVMLVMSVQAIANIVPFTPGGAGAQQALLVATLHGPSRAAVLSFSVGTQIAMAAWSVVLGFAAILLVFRTTDWRGLISQAQDEADKEEAGGDARRRNGRSRSSRVARPARVCGP